MNRYGIVLLTGLAVSLGLGTPANGGVVFEVETENHALSPPKSETREMAAEGKNLTIGLPAGPEGSESQMIYRGDRREMVFVDHANRSYMVFDQETLESLAEQLGQISQQMEEMLQNVPESQRAAMEQMMKDRMPQQPAAPVTEPLEVEKTGETGEMAGYPCVKYILRRDQAVVSELWVTDWDNVEGGEEIAGVFRDMASFMKQMLENLSSSLGPKGAGMGEGMLEMFGQIDGFPVVTRQFDGEALESESSLRSARRETLGPDAFEPPSGYKRQQMMR